MPTYICKWKCSYTAVFQHATDEWDDKEDPTGQPPPFWQHGWRVPRRFHPTGCWPYRWRSRVARRKSVSDVESLRLNPAMLQYWNRATLISVSDKVSASWNKSPRQTFCTRTKEALTQHYLAYLILFQNFGHWWCPNLFVYSKCTLSKLSFSCVSLKSFRGGSKVGKLTCQTNLMVVQVIWAFEQQWNMDKWGNW